MLNLSYLRRASYTGFNICVVTVMMVYMLLVPKSLESNACWEASTLTDAITVRSCALKCALTCLGSTMGLHLF